MAESEISTKPYLLRALYEWCVDNGYTPHLAVKVDSRTQVPLEYAKTRVQWGKPIAGFQLTQEKLVNMALELNKGMLLALHIGRLKDEGKALPEHISTGKLNNVREALAICREARTILGANGITLEYPVIRHMNNLESVITYEGTHDIHSLVLGEALTGIPAYKG